MKYNYLNNLLIIVVLLFSIFSGKAQTYTVSAIPHQVYVPENVSVSLTTLDDRYSELIELKGTSIQRPSFDFNFFGNTYNSIIVSTNGYIDFRANLANTRSIYFFNSAIPTTNSQFPAKNSILGCFHDMDGRIGDGEITYAVIGREPYRKFVVNFKDQPLFFCQTLKSSFQMILYETLDIIDVQIIKKELPCASSSSKLSIIGLHNEFGTYGIAPPGRNAGIWSAFREGWRFAPTSQSTLPVYKYTKCDVDLNGIEDFNLQIVRNNLSSPDMTFHETLQNANDETFPKPTIYTNIIANYQKLYGRKSDGSITEIILRAINCNNNFDYDLDGIPTILEDLNGDGNLENDDTNSDGIPNFLDNDDDGDMVLTSVEYVFVNTGINITALLDTDNDGIPNYLDNNDDGDGVLTINEDYNHNNNPADDDTNNNGIPDYLESAVALGVKNNDFKNSVSLYPNPASTVLSIENGSGEEIKSVSIYSITGALVKQINNAQEIKTISISELQNGMYFVKMQVGNQVINNKIIKK